MTKGRINHFNAIFVCLQGPGEYDIPEPDHEPIYSFGISLNPAYYGGYDEYDISYCSVCSKVFQKNH